MVDAQQVLRRIERGHVRGSEREAQEVRALQPDFSPGHWLQTDPLTDARQRQTLLELLALGGIQPGP